MKRPTASATPAKAPISTLLLTFALTIADLCACMPLLSSALLEQPKARRNIWRSAVGVEEIQVRSVYAILRARAAIRQRIKGKRLGTKPAAAPRPAAWRGPGCSPEPRAPPPDDSVP